MVDNTDDAEYTTIRVTKSEHQEANERRKAAGMDWGDWITDERRGAEDAESIADAVADELEARGVFGE